MAYMQNLKNVIQVNLFTKQKQTHSLRERIYGYQRERKKESEVAQLCPTP